MRNVGLRTAESWIIFGLQRGRRNMLHNVLYYVSKFCFCDCVDFSVVLIFVLLDSRCVGFIDVLFFVLLISSMCRFERCVDVFEVLTKRNKALRHVRHY